MKLGSKQKTDDFLSSLMAEGEKVVTDPAAAARAMPLARQPSLKQGGPVEGYACLPCGCAVMWGGLSCGRCRLFLG